MTAKSPVCVIVYYLISSYATVSYLSIVWPNYFLIRRLSASHISLIHDIMWVDGMTLAKKMSIHIYILSRRHTYILGGGEGGAHARVCVMTE